MTTTMRLNNMTELAELQERMKGKPATVLVESGWVKASAEAARHHTRYGLRRFDMTETTKAWAIKMFIPGHLGPNFMGIFFCAKYPLEDYQDGLRICLFGTRAQARKKLKELCLSGYLRAKVVRVKVIIAEICKG